MQTQKHQQGNFWLAAVFMLVIVGLIAVLIAPVLTDVQSFASHFGFKSRAELHQDIAKANNNTSIAVGENEFLAAKVQKQADTNDAAVVAVDGRHRVDEKIDKTTTQVKQIKKQKLDAVSVKYKNQPQKQLAPTPQSQEIAAAQIDGLWTAYCSFNTEPGCSATEHVS